jgi:Family of unknown function (DUF6172)
MKKTFQLQRPGKHPDRVLDAIKHEVRQYMRRERAKPMPAGAHFLDFDCKIGLSAADAASLHAGDLTAKMDELAQAGAQAFYVEILSKPGVRQARVYEMGAAPASDQADQPASDAAPD